MKRRNFFKSVAIAGTAAVVAPAVLCEPCVDAEIIIPIRTVIWDHVTLTPKRIVAHYEISEQLILESIFHDKVTIIDL